MCANREGCGQTARMGRLIWAFAICHCHKYLFHMGRLIWYNHRKCRQKYTTKISHRYRLIFINNIIVHTTSEPPHNKTNEMSVRPAKTQISLGIRPVWSESSLCAQWVAKDPTFLHAGSEGSDQTGRMPRLIWVFAGRTCHFVGFVMRQLICHYFYLFVIVSNDSKQQLQVVVKSIYI